jgi:hypothetical protein
MAVISYREVIPRTASHRFGESPTAERKVVVTVDAPTPTQELVDAVGIFHTQPHPEFPFLRCLNLQVSETDRHHAEITYSYELPKQEELDPNPLARPDVWSFSTGGAQVPTLVYYEGSGNRTRRPLQNTAKDFFEGLTTLEAEVRASIAGNRPIFPLDNAAAITNSVNAFPYLGGNTHTWLCAGISGQQATEVVNGQELRFWQITVELIYRASGHDLLLPNVGWNYIENGSRQRAWVWNENKTEKVASGSPRALNSSGGLKPDDQGPDILSRRIYPEVDFSAYFGTPPF